MGIFSSKRFFLFYFIIFTSQSEPRPGWCRCSRLMSLGRQTKNCEGRKEIFLMTHWVTSKPLGWVTDLAKEQIVIHYYKWTKSLCFSTIYLSFKYIPINIIRKKGPHTSQPMLLSPWKHSIVGGCVRERVRQMRSGSSRYKQMRHSFILTCSLGARSRQRGFHTSAKISFISSADSNLVCLSKALHKPSHVSYCAAFMKYISLITLFYKKHNCTAHLYIFFLQGWKKAFAT